MKKSVDELIEVVNNLGIDDDSKISLMEDITDSITADDNKVDRSEYDDLEAKYKDLQERYKSRFMDAGKPEDPKPEDPEDENDVYIDIKDI